MVPVNFQQVRMVVLGNFFSNNTLDRVYSYESSSSSSTSQVWAKFESGSNFHLIFFSLIIPSDCYSRNDVQVVNGKINFQVCIIFHHRLLEQFNIAVERYATSLCVHNVPKKIKTCSCIHLKQRYHFHDWQNGRRWSITVWLIRLKTTKVPSCYVHRTPM